MKIIFKTYLKCTAWPIMTNVYTHVTHRSIRYRTLLSLQKVSSHPYWSLPPHPPPKAATDLIYVTIGSSVYSRVSYK